MTKHTPGPWRVGTLEAEDMPYEVFSTEEGGRRVAVMTATHENDDTRANATLCAAAPDMLSALSAIVAADNCNYDLATMRREGLFEAARAALNKAEGGAV